MGEQRDGASFRMPAARIRNTASHRLPGLYGAYSAFFTNPGLPAYANGVIKLDKIAQSRP